LKLAKAMKSIAFDNWQEIHEVLVKPASCSWRLLEDGGSHLSLWSSRYSSYFESKGRGLLVAGGTSEATSPARPSLRDARTEQAMAGHDRGQGET